MKFLTQGFTRGFFRNLDERPAELRITKFTPPPRQARHLCGPDYQDYSHYIDEPRYSAPEGTTERLLEESAHLGVQIEVGKRHTQSGWTGCPESVKRDHYANSPNAFLNEDNNYGQ